ncbi:hypothetical protein GCM10010346_57710 [Streptomyces chryseus]|uniref:Uncharacterized protein n=1 Tax=Streptomyces chryseus TaxID=68186 RepID=A0ABQ3E5A0_9ACTN|nr:hypothetical protein GCM10010346_57710 [Streptomyces chryseus]
MYGGNLHEAAGTGVDDTQHDVEASRGNRRHPGGPDHALDIDKAVAGALSRARGTGSLLVGTVSLSLLGADWEPTGSRLAPQAPEAGRRRTAHGVD